MAAAVWGDWRERLKRRGRRLGVDAGWYHTNAGVRWWVVSRDGLRDIARCMLIDVSGECSNERAAREAITKRLQDRLAGLKALR